MPDLMRDPVCGMDIGIHEAVASVATEERHFYFCCLGCHAAFLDTPHRYVGWAEDPIRPLPAAVASGRSSFEPCHYAS
jgi:YHS domain-containing protein